MSLSVKDIHRVGKILADAAQHQVMPRFRRLSASSVRMKSSAFDIVTEADEAAELAITQALRADFPGAIVVGEESCHRDPSLLEEIGSAELAFLVDPIDGTKNFSSNLPLFGLMAAATVRGEIVAGVIYDPVCRDWAYALPGGGAWIEYEDGARLPLHVAPPVPVSEMDGIIATRFLPEPLRHTVNRNLARLGMATWLRCSAHEYRMAATGFCHLLLYNKLMPWDHAAGWLLHREAGGFSAHFDGTPYRPTQRTGGLICAPDRASWTAARDALLME